MPRPPKKKRVVQRYRTPDDPYWDIRERKSPPATVYRIRRVLDRGDTQWLRRFIELRTGWWMTLWHSDEKLAWTFFEKEQNQALDICDFLCFQVERHTPSAPPPGVYEVVEGTLVK